MYQGIRFFGSSGINGTLIFACRMTNGCGCKLYIWLKIFAVPFLPLDPIFLSIGFIGKGTLDAAKDEYNSPEIRSLNSQVNEQANSGLQRIKGHLPYMKPHNFKFTLSLFLAICNRDKISGLMCAKPSAH